MTTPAELLVLKYGEVPLIHIGDVKVVNTGGVTKELAFYGARIKAGNQVSNNLLLVSVPLAMDPSEAPRTIGQLSWVSVYLRSYFSLKNANDVLPLQWEKLAASKEYNASTDELPTGMWVKEVKVPGRSQLKIKHYTFTDPSFSTKYLVTLESRLKDSLVGNDLKDSYEFDLLLGYNGHFLAIERLAM